MLKKYVIISNDKVVTSSSALDRAKEYAAIAAKDGGDGSTAHIYSFVTTAVNQAVTFNNTLPCGKTNGAGKAKKAVKAWSENEDAALKEFIVAARKKYPNASDKMLAKTAKKVGVLPARTESALLNRMFVYRKGA